MEPSNAEEGWGKFKLAFFRRGGMLLRRFDGGGCRAITPVRWSCRFIGVLLVLITFHFPLFIPLSHADDPRFVDLQNGTMCDTVSKLIWLKDAGCFGLESWNSANDAANILVTASAA